MTLEWIPLDALEAHPENSNRMPARLLEKLKEHIRRTGLYEPLVVRPLGERGTRNAERGTQDKETTTAAVVAGVPRSDFRVPSCRYQILNGHHRAEVLRQLGHTHARCDVWDVDDQEARVLLATLNRLEGRDDPAARAQLVARLAEGRSAEEIGRLLPEPAEAVQRLLALSEPPPAPLDARAAALLARPMTFFLSEEQHAVVTEALGEIARANEGSCAPRATGDEPRDTGPDEPRPACDEPPAAADEPRDTGPDEPRPASLAPGEYTGGRQADGIAKRAAHSMRPPVYSRGAKPTPRLPRAEALERLALWYLESMGVR